MQENKHELTKGVEVDLQKLLLAYLRQWWLIALCGLVAGSMALLYTMNFVTPQYRTSVSIIVNNRSAEMTVEETTSASLAASMRLVNTYINVISSDTVLSRVVERAKLEYSVEEIRGMMSTEQMDDTEMFRVYVTHPDPEIAVQVANAIAREALDGIEEFVEGSSALVVDYAKVPQGRYSPSYSKSGIVGGCVGGIIALVYVTLRYLLDVRLKTSEDLDAVFDIPVLGQIPVFVSAETKSKSGYGYYARKSGYGYETQKSEGKEESK